MTGVRFVKKNHVFYIQIQQGRLGASGTIDPDTVDWKAVENQETFENLTVVQVSTKTLILLNTRAHLPMIPSLDE